MGLGLREIGTRFARFGAVGALGVVVNTGVLFVAHGIARMPLLIASPLAVEVAILHNFLLNERWTFGEPRVSLRRLGMFNLTSLGGLVIASATLYALVTWVGLHYLVANLIGIGLAMVWNFATSLIWTWGWRR